MSINPYQPPSDSDDIVAREDPFRLPVRRRRKLAIICMCISMLASMGYTMFDEVIWKTSFGAWPTVFGTCAFSVLVAIICKDAIFSPLCCFAGTMSGDLLAGVVRSWQYAQVDACIVISLAFSVPAVIIAWVRYRFGKRIPAIADTM